MNNEHDKPVDDPGLSDAYRALATEKAPESLNQRVLKRAAIDRHRLKKTNMTSSLWMKPVAWAAMMGLCLALVLEITRMSEVYDVEKVVAPVRPEPDSDILQSSDANDAPSEKAQPTTGSRQKLTLEQAEPHAATKEDEKQRQDRLMDSSVSKPSAAKPAAMSLQEAGRSQPASTALTSETKAENIESNACGTAIRQSPKEWLICIEDLRRAGLAAAADAEFDAFERAFPAEAAEIQPDR